MADVIKAPMKMTACCWCKRQFSKRSLAIHEKSCRKVTSQQQQQQQQQQEDVLEVPEKKEVLDKPWRRPNRKRWVSEADDTPPEKPAHSESEVIKINAVVESDDELDAMATECDGLVPCETCGRTFLPDRLQVHMRSCAKANPAPKPTKTRTPKNVAKHPRKAAPAPVQQVGLISFDDFAKTMSS